MRLKQQPIVRLPVARVPYHHSHGCDTCGRRFQDTCARPMEQRTCATCRLGQPPTVEDVDRQPRECCGSYTRLITSVDILSKYGLAGHTPWFQCMPPHGCARTHPFNPLKDKDVTP